MKILWIALAFLAGVFLPLQGGINSRLGKIIASPINASLISFLVGALTLFSYTLLSRQHAQWSGLKAMPLYLWCGGIFGAFYVTVIVLAFPKIGPALTFGLVVAGQMMASLALSHFNILVEAANPLRIGKLLGVLLVIVGVFIIQKS